MQKVVEYQNKTQLLNSDPQVSDYDNLEKHCWQPENARLRQCLACIPRAACRLMAHLGICTSMPSRTSPLRPSITQGCDAQARLSYIEPCASRVLIGLVENAECWMQDGPETPLTVSKNFRNTSSK